MSVLKKLTENIVSRNLSRDGAALMEKWERTGLLEGITDDNKRQGMARLLENQASQLLKEASTLGARDVEGFASVAFPIVRRVFGGLIANELVSVQPMSLPSGLIFFLDFKYDDNVVRAGATAGESVYGGGRLGSAITGGVILTGSHAEKSFYALNNGYSSPSGTMDHDTNLVPHTESAADGTSVILSGSLRLNQLTGSNAFARRVLRHDPDLVETQFPVVLSFPKASFTDLDEDNLQSIRVDASAANTIAADGAATLADGPLTGMTDVLDTTPVQQIRRLTQVDPNNEDNIILVFMRTTIARAGGAAAVLTGDVTIEYARQDDFINVDGAVPGGVVGDIFALEGAQNVAGGDVGGENVAEAATENPMAELNIDVSSIAVTTQTKKLKAKWTPELGQDLNAYHNLDAEVELTQLLSEHIALEIDREILEDLSKRATADTYHWSRRPGKFLNRSTGEQVGGDVANESLMGADFTGTVSEWYETLIETMNDVSAQIHRKTLRGGANFVVCGPEVANILEFTSGFRANVSHEDNKGDVGAVKAGSLSRKWDVWVDPYFPRSTILMGRRGSSFLESGYVYAPYVPLQVTPTIFGTEDFVPRKGVMTRYAKKMVRPDMYGLVIVHDLLG